MQSICQRKPFEYLKWKESTKWKSLPRTHYSNKTITESKEETMPDVGVLCGREQSGNNYNWTTNIHLLHLRIATGEEKKKKTKKKWHSVWFYLRERKSILFSTSCTPPIHPPSNRESHLRHIHNPMSHLWLNRSSSASSSAVCLLRSLAILLSLFTLLPFPTSSHNQIANINRHFLSLCPRFATFLLVLWCMLILPFLLLLNFIFISITYYLELIS